MTTVHYPVSLPYRVVPKMGFQPAIEVVLFHGDKTTKAVAILDSGSPYTVFSSEHAQLLGIDEVTDGTLEKITTFGGGTEIYLFALDIQLVGAGPRFSGQIGFFASHRPRNILGRSVVFSAFEIGFRERDQMIHFRIEV